GSVEDRRFARGRARKSNSRAVLTQTISDERLEAALPGALAAGRDLVHAGDAEEVPGLEDPFLLPLGLGADRDSDVDGLVRILDVVGGPGHRFPGGNAECRHDAADGAHQHVAAINERIPRQHRHFDVGDRVGDVRAESDATLGQEPRDFEAQSRRLLEGHETAGGKAGLATDFAKLTGRTDRDGRKGQSAFGTHCLSAGRTHRHTQRKRESQGRDCNEFRHLSRPSMRLSQPAVVSRPVIWATTAPDLSISSENGNVPSQPRRSRNSSCPAPTSIGYGTLNSAANARMPSGLSSVEMPMMVRPCALYFSDKATSCGVSSLQGPHHVAQRLMTTGLPW